MINSCSSVLAEMGGFAAKQSMCGVHDRRKCACATIVKSIVNEEEKKSDVTQSF